jgi:hypothetical protein
MEWQYRVSLTSIITPTFKSMDEVKALLPKSSCIIDLETNGLFLIVDNNKIIGIAELVHIPTKEMYNGKT